ncbi:MAG: multiprotein-bridging factor 1 family protein [Candidatus Micrarchaeota archaeon]
MECQTCGKNAAGEGLVEGARVPLCERCAGYADDFSYYAPPKTAKKKPNELPAKAVRVSMEIADDYGKIIARARDARGMTRKELAAKLFIHENELASFEESRIKPSETLAKKLEFALGVKLFEEIEVDTERKAAASKKNEGVSLADVLEVKKR